jgi:hypothetical protein
MPVVQSNLEVPRSKARCVYCCATVYRLTFRAEAVQEFTPVCRDESHRHLVHVFVDVDVVVGLSEEVGRGSCVILSSVSAQP